MLQNCYNRNTFVTNGESGSKSAIVKSGSQKAHAKNWKENTAMTTTIMTAHGPRVCVCELGAGQSKLGAETLIRETAMYYYTVESYIVKKPQYFIGNNRSWDCTVYSTKEEAKTHIHETALLWHWDEKSCHIIEKETEEIITKNHRWKKG